MSRWIFIAWEIQKFPCAIDFFSSSFFVCWPKPTSKFLHIISNFHTSDATKTCFDLRKMKFIHLIACSTAAKSYPSWQETLFSCSYQWTALEASHHRVKLLWQSGKWRIMLTLTRWRLFKCQRVAFFSGKLNISLTLAHFMFFVLLIKHDKLIN